MEGYGIVDILGILAAIITILGPIVAVVISSFRFKRKVKRLLKEILGELKESNKYLNTISGNSNTDLPALIEALNKRTQEIHYWHQ